MRGPLLAMFRPVTSLRGVGIKHAQNLKRLLLGERILDLLFHTPRSYLHYHPSQVACLQEGQRVVLDVDVLKIVRRPKMTMIECGDDSGEIQVTYFQGQKQWIENKFVLNRRVRLQGVVSRYGRHLQLVHPDLVRDSQQAGQAQIWLPVYGLVQGIKQGQLRQWIAQALAGLPQTEEWLDKNRVEDWPDWATSLRKLHQPQCLEDTQKTGAHWLRLTYDELFSHALALAVMRNRYERHNAWSFHDVPHIKEKMIKRLAFTLTNDQQQAVKKIESSLQTGQRMTSLLLGDVGSGKTVVAFAAVSIATQAGYQSALLAPTELLARQHYKTACAMLEGLVPTYLLTASTKAKERAMILDALKSEQPVFVIGTQSLLSDHLDYGKLGLVIIDEQHRFGVQQRLSLRQKGDHPHLLLLSATPIPRTMQMVLYHDLDILSLREKPAGRQPIETRLLSARRRSAVIERLRYALARQQKAYWVCPLVEEDISVETPSVMVRAKELQSRLDKESVLFIHGKMPSQEQAKVMEQFRQTKGAVLVASTVIEVGVDVQDADIIIIDGAERYGLAQLHQLRGRVGRGDEKSYCLLIHQDGISEIAQERLRALCSLDDGFELSEIDLKLRGAGDLVGDEQSGFLAMRFFDPFAHLSLLEKAANDANAFLSQDPSLSTQRAHNYCGLLSLFDKDHVLRAPPA